MMNLSEQCDKELDYSLSSYNVSLTKTQKIDFLTKMRRIRNFEYQALNSYNQDKMGGFLHLYNGQESIAVIAASLMQENDHTITAYRDHGHALAVGMDINSCMAELFGKSTGCSKGKGGSMHFFAPEKKYWGGHGIVGGQTPLGLGLAFSLKYKNISGCVLTFLGDGAVNQGVFSESLNIAALWNLPIVYIIENNGYSMGTSLERSSSIKNSLAYRAEGFNVEWNSCHGYKIYESRSVLGAAMDKSRLNSKPILLEIMTYRYYGHSVADANAKKYRSVEEIDKYKKFHDPILLWEKQLLEEKLITEQEIKEIDLKTKSEVLDAIQFATESPWPRPESIFEDIYYEVDHQTDSSSMGEYFF